MDLGISGKKAIVCAASKGLGFGCAQRLSEAGVDLVICARSEAPLNNAATLLRKTGVTVDVVACDITTSEGQNAVLDAAGEVDILISNAGGPPPGHWSNWDRDDFLTAVDANMLTPIALMTAVLPGMKARGWGRIVNITSQSVKAPIAALGLSNTARTGLTGFVAGVSRDVAPYGVTINNLLPGAHDTDRIAALDQSLAASKGIDIDVVRSAKFDTIPARRYGTKEEFGAMCAFLCSQHAGYIVGQNILLDGGGINATI
ncbi:MAG: SDR family oxidoreductase [Pseudomonadota bacterium]